MATSATSKLPPVPIVCTQLVETPGMSRATRFLATQEARVVFIADCDCKVQIITPPSPQCFIAIDEDPADLGPNRMPFLSCPLPTDTLVFPTTYRAGQTIVIAVRKGQAICGLIVERLMSGAAGGAL